MISRILVGIAAATLVSCSAFAGPITVVGDGTTNNNGDPGNFKATFSYAYNATAMAYQLTVTMENTTASGNGNLTGFAFGGVAIADIAMTLSSVSGTGATTDPDWFFVANTTWNPYGTFKYGATLPPNFNGGGSGASGIDTSETGTFVFNVTGSGAGLLDESDFLQDNAEGEFILVRFKGLAGDEGSDHLPGQIVLIPLPAPVWMAGAGLLAVVGYRMKRRTV